MNEIYTYIMPLLLLVVSFFLGKLYARFEKSENKIEGLDRRLNTLETTVTSDKSYFKELIDIRLAQIFKDIEEIKVEIKKK